MENKQLLAVRLFNQGLLRPLEQPTAAFARIVGIQSQQPQAAWLNWALHTAAPEAAFFKQLVEQRQLVRAWGQRWTLHLLSPADLQLVISARQAEKLPAAYFRDQKDQVLAVVAAIKQLLEHQSVFSRASLLAELQNEFPNLPLDGRFIYAVLQFLSAQGALYFDASSTTQNWRIIAATPPQNDTNALAVLIQRYLAGFGPASMTDFVRWAGIKLSTVRPVWQQFVAQRRPFQAELFSLQDYSRSQLQELTDELAAKVLIAAPYDASMTGYANKDWLMPPRLQKIMWTKNGILRAPIIVNGELSGYWIQQVKGARLHFTIVHWQTLTANVQQKIQAKLVPLAQLQSLSPTFKFQQLT
ncbi:DNA glycosylase AlkZ-like family protein [Loigolactobacillus coryniformis subsp. coryniformis]|jgi:hypothetical protein|uniref:Uncharacterized protein n=1 Tax=Loigolactobacillus coryniformis subsp. torquens DSM 20004 = KCTC 3535 TaxID=1423822 RepID=A0A2D1KRA9_9LACO|nr:crosslink repair DNA glycosylase YcaQ family protein [Loigolactobacillus coryniformis]ATO44582.1 hypothetical protein LC20004_12015 [Loigolactobacillus coryniformis subsp. torquens DSM 20004 = KCTC 3535]KRK85372.1 hypothetical protein FC16_GL001925 [Loigolactobacillus coryniformis subsp. torquens DSM 20004 = KCTC 3535]